MTLTGVFELVHEPPHDTATSVGRNRAIEVKRAVLAIGATESLGDRARERLGTTGAEWRDNSRRAPPTPFAEILGAVDVFGADHARRRIKERKEGVNRFKNAGGRHFLTKA